MFYIRFIKKYFFIFASLAALILSAQQINTVVPTVNGKMQVSKTGSLTYNVPIEVPKGVSGFQPNLALTYDSNSGEGTAGLGWNVFGLSFITRGGKTKDTDGVTEGRQYNDSDPLYLDGNRMIIEGNSIRLKNFSHAKVEKLNNGYIVKHPDGKVATYELLIEGQYGIKKLEDAMGNLVDYHYTTASGVLYLDRIVYGKDREFVVQFVQTERENPVKIWRNGSQLINNKVISEIQVKAQGNLFRKYVLQHDLTTKGSVRIKRISVENGQGEALKPLDFTYNDEEPILKINKKIKRNSGFPNRTKAIGSSVIGDFFGTGQMSSIYAVKVYDDYRLQIPGRLGPSQSLVGDINEKTQFFAGKLRLNNKKLSENDLLITVNKIRSIPRSRYSIIQFNYRLEIEITNLKTEVKEKSFNIPRIFSASYRSKGAIENGILKIRKKGIVNTILSDFTGDGSVDLMVFASSEGGSWKNSKEIYLIDFSKPLKNSTLQPELLVSGGENLSWFNGLRNADRFYPIEFDGDGVPELLHINNYTKKYDILKFNRSTRKLSVLLSNQPLSNFSEKTPLIFGDYNGDGLTDFITPNETYSIEKDGILGTFEKINKEFHYWQQYLSTGKRFIRKARNFNNLSYCVPSQRNIIKESSFFAKFWSGKGDEYKHTDYGACSIIPMDFDHDGRTDLISFRKVGKIKYQEEIKNSEVNMIDRGSIYGECIAKRGFTKSLECARDYDTIADKLNEIVFVKNTRESQEEFDFSSSHTLSLKDDNISPISFVVTSQEAPAYSNAIKNQVIIHDPLSKKDYHFSVSSDRHLEAQIQKVDNHSGVRQTIEYASMDGKHDNDNPIYKAYYSTAETDQDVEAGKTATTYNRLGSNFYLIRNAPTQYLVKLINTYFDNQTLTKRYRYINALQDIENGRFLGFMKTFVSDNYEPKQYIVSKYSKDSKKPIFWTVNTYDPNLDNRLIETVYGGIGKKMGKEPYITKSTISYTKLTSKENSFLGPGQVQYQKTREINKDFRTDVTVEKTYTYDANNLLLQSINTKYGSDGSSLTGFTYAPASTNGNHRFYGKVTGTTERTSVPGDVFTTREEISYLSNGLISQKKKYGHNTDAVTTAYTYDNYGNILTQSVSVEDETLTTSYTYDPSRRFVVGSTSPEGLKTTKQVDIFGNTLKTTSPLSLETRYAYDGWHNLIKTTDYLGNRTRHERHPTRDGGYYVTDVRAGFPQTITYYNKLGRKVRIKTRTLNSKWSVVDTRYDVYGKVIDQSEPYFEGDSPTKWNGTLYDIFDRPIQKISYTGKIVNTCYNGRTVTVEDDYEKAVETSNAMGRVIKHIDKGGTIDYRYYANGTLKEADYQGIVIKVEQDGWGNKTRLEDPSAGVYEYTYDDWGRKLTEKTPKGTTSYGYDRFGKLLYETQQGDNTNLSSQYIYDSDTHLLLKVTGSNGADNFEYETFYDKYYRIKGKKETHPAFTYLTNTTFDAYGRPDRLKTDLQVRNISQKIETEQQNRYDTHGILYALNDLKTAKTIWTLNEENAHGQALQTSFGNGFDLINTYKDNLPLTIRHQTSSGHTAISTDYAFDAVKGVLENRENKIFNRRESFIFDDLKRLIKECHNGDVPEPDEDEEPDNTTHDPFFSGSSTSFPILSRQEEYCPVGTLSKQYTYDHRGRITYSTDLGKYEYPSDNFHINKIHLNRQGEQAKKDKGFANVTYNAYKKPVEITLDGKGRVSYDYNPFQKRAVAYYGSEDTDKSARPLRKYYSAGGELEITHDTRANTIKVVQYIDGDPYDASYIKISRFENDQFKQTKVYYLHRDYLGSILAVSDNNANIVEQRRFDAWGKLSDYQSFVEGLSRSRPLLDRGYTGHEHLWEVGLVHMNARMYSPLLRRFLSPDNFVADPYHTQQYNRYGYVLNNPLIYTDPSGDIPFLAVLGSALLFKSMMNIANGVPFWYGWGKTAAQAIVSSAIGGVVAKGGALYNAAASTKAAFQLWAHALSGGMFNVLEGENFAAGFASGALASAVGSAVGGLKIGNPALLLAAQAAAGGLSGGLGSVIAGGNFWRGAQQGAIVAVYNHAVHGIFSSEEGPTYEYKKDKNGNYVKVGNEGGNKIDYLLDKDGNVIDFTEVKYSSGGNNRTYGEFTMLPSPALIDVTGDIVFGFFAPVRLAVLKAVRYLRGVSKAAKIAKGSKTIVNSAKQAKQWLGKDYKGITNKAGDHIFMSKDGLRKIRFDLKNTSGDAPHIHLEIFKNGKWRDAIRGTHRIYPKK